MTRASRRVLCVDDEPNVLSGLERTLFEHFDVDTATSGSEGLELLEEDGPYAVVISDMRMPKMNGARFLSEVRTRAPDTVRMLLTGHSDIESAVAAINHGAIFRFLCKPCPSDVLVSSLEMAADHYRLVRAERELLEDTLKGTIDVLSQVLGLVSPAAFSRADQVEAYVAHMARVLEVEDLWVYQVAARLSPLGCVALPADVVGTSVTVQPLGDGEREMTAAHPAAGARLLERIPRLEPVAAMIAAQDDPDSADHPQHRLGAAMIRLAIAVDRDVARGKTLDQAVVLARRNKAHHPRLLEAMAAFSGREQCARSSSTS